MEHSILLVDDEENFSQALGQRLEGMGYIVHTATCGRDAHSPFGCLSDRMPPMSADAPRILIVDDEVNICRNCEKILSKMDCVVSIAQNGKDALALIEAEPFDVVVTDLKMSRMGGMEVLRRVTEKDPDIRVIVMTGYASVSSAVEVMKIGAFDYLPKPFTPHELRAVVLQAITDRMTDKSPGEIDTDLLFESDEVAASGGPEHPIHLEGGERQTDSTEDFIQQTAPLMEPLGVLFEM